MKTNNEEKLARGPLVRTMLSLGIPTFIAQLINLLYNVVDRMYIGHIEGYGAMALTGVGVSAPIITLVAAFTNLIGYGGAPLAGIAFGKGDKEEAERVLGNSFFFLIALSIILTIVFQVIKEPFLYMFGASDVTYPYAGEYLEVYLYGTVFVMVTLGLNSYITVQGFTRVSMLTILIGAVLNLILDPVFIFALHMGVRGAALATVLSQAVSAVWVVRFLTSKKATLRIRKKFLMPDFKILLKICSLGVSPFIMAATESLITVIFNKSALTYGNDLYVGSMTILHSVNQMVFTPLSGFNQGVLPIISYNYGARNIDRMKKTCKILILITFSFSFIFTGLSMLFPGLVSGFFTSDTELIAICEKMLPVYLAGMLVFGLQSGCQNCFMALGKARQSFFFAIFRKVLLLTPLALILPAAMNDILGLYLAEPISDALSAITCFVVFMLTLRKTV